MESLAGHRGLRGTWAWGAEHQHANALGAHADPTDCDRGFHHHIAALGVAPLCRTPFSEGAARRLPRPTVAGINHHAEAPHFESDREPIHPVRGGYCEGMDTTAALAQIAVVDVRFGSMLSKKSFSGGVRKF